jgi:hypothetical protein
MVANVGKPAAHITGKLPNFESGCNFLPRRFPPKFFLFSREFQSEAGCKLERLNNVQRERTLRRAERSGRRSALNSRLEKVASDRVTERQ